MKNEIQKYPVSMMQLIENQQHSEIVKFLFTENAPIEKFCTDHDNYPTINRLHSLIGAQGVIISLVSLLEYVLKNISVPEPSKEQIIFIAKELFADFQHFKLQDFHIFFKKYMKGEYGSDFNRFDIKTIYSALKKYENERMDIFYQKIESKKNELNSNPSIRTNDIKKVKEILMAAKAKAAKEKEQEKIINSKKLQWKIEAKIHWEKSKQLYYETHPDADPLYYDYNFPLSVHTDWYIRKKVNELKSMTTL